MKRIILTLLFISTILSLAGCGNEEHSEKEDTNPIVGKIYNDNTFSGIFDFDFMKFYDDNTFQGIEIVSISKSKNHYGTYTINENALTLNISDKTYAGVILDNGATITFDDAEFIDWTEYIKDTDPILDKFK